MADFAEQIVGGIAPDYLEEIKRLSVKYANYRQAMPSEIKVRDVQNDIEKRYASTTEKSVNWIIGVGLAAFALTTVFAFATKQISGGVLSLIGTVALLYFFLGSFLSKPKIAYGTAVWKHFRFSNHAGSGSRHPKIYYFTVIFEEPEKIIVKDIQTTKEAYESAVEGTPVMVIKKGTVYQARLYS
ncbi:MAG: hypothetical protein J6Z74_04530 [Eubacterium sp.]|nr:hypothetical protein [Eubacterium sp.]